MLVMDCRAYPIASCHLLDSIHPQTDQTILPLSLLSDDMECLGVVRMAVLVAEPHLHC